MPTPSLKRSSRLLRFAITSSSVQLTVLNPQPPARNTRPCIALVGNPNAGKTTLFNALTGLRAKTANFPGTTIEHHIGRMTLAGQDIELLDLPGLYSLQAATNEERVARDALLGEAPGLDKPLALIVLIDATNLERNLFLASQAMELRLPTVVALNMIDLAHNAGIKINVKALAKELGCPVVPTAARSGKGIESLRKELERILDPAVPEKPIPAATGCTTCKGCPFQARYDWAEGVGSRVIASPRTSHGRHTEAIDRALTHPVLGVLAFLAVMFAVFVTIFWIAQYPMGGIQWLFTTLGGYTAHGLNWLGGHLPPGAARTLVRDDLRSLLVEGILGGVGGVLVFIPQICILFFFLSLLEDTGYLARAAFVMDRLMRHVGLPGKAFVPMLSAHACAVPAIMSARVIEDRRDRLVTILVLPLMTCSARIPVYAMVLALLFPHAPFEAAALFAGAYVLGVVAALTMAWFFKRTLLRGETRPLVLELPSYKFPNFRNAFFTMLDRAMIFVRNAGTVILVVSVILWALAHYPKSDPPAAALALVQQAQTLQAQGHAEQAQTLLDQAEHTTSQYALAHSLAGRIGHVLEPAIHPLGFDWQIGIGVVSSFAAREVFVSTLAIVYGVGADAAEQHPTQLYDTLHNATRSNGQPVFTVATCVSLLVFYVLAMQCMSTLAVSRRETGSWKWPALQFFYMSVLAYGGALTAYQLLHALGVS